MRYLVCIVIVCLTLTGLTSGLSGDEDKKPDSAGGPDADPHNCTAPPTGGVFDLCCEMRGCVWVNCSDEDRCEFERASPEDWGHECLTAKDQCRRLMSSTDGTVTGAPEADKTTPSGDISANTTAADITNTTVSGQNTTAVPVTTPQSVTNKTDPTQGPVETTTASMDDTTVTTESPAKCGRKFDAASFVGGMVLMLGVLSIVFFACKYYKSKAEQRYRQF